EDQLTLTPRVAGIDNGRDIFTVKKFLELVEAFLRICDRLESKLFRNDRQSLESPESIFLLVDVFGHFQLDNVTYRGRNEVLVVFVMGALLGNFTEGAGKVLRNAGFLGDDEGFGHEGMPSRPPWRGLQVGGTEQVL